MAKRGPAAADRYKTFAGGRATAGFTLIELIAVIVLTSIMAFVAMPRMIDHTFDEKALHDGVQAALQHARRVAVASRRYVCANVTAGTGSTGAVALRMDTTAPESVVTVVCTTAVGGTAVSLPAPGRGCAATNEVCASNGVTLGGASVIFDPLGRSVDSAKNVQATVLVVTVSNQPNISVQAETGFVQ